LRLVSSSTADKMRASMAHGICWKFTMSLWHSPSELSALRERVQYEVLSCTWLSAFRATSSGPQINRGPFLSTSCRSMRGHVSTSRAAAMKVFAAGSCPGTKWRGQSCGHCLSAYHLLV
jgi:hypothetical protein